MNYLRPYLPTASDCVNVDELFDVDKIDRLIFASEKIVFNQQSLGEECQKILHDNLWNLYES